MSAMNKLYLTLEHVAKSYARSVLRDVNLTVTNDSYVTILGKSGSGKSTMLNILGLLEDYDAGEYRLNGTLIRNGRDYVRLRAENIGFIFQSYNLISTMTCRENILLPTLYGNVKDTRGIEGLAERLGIAPLLEQRVNTLSGGEKQRVAVARALILDPCLILADEPTGNLDVQNRDIIMDLLREEHKRGRGVILITHDMQTASCADTVYRLEDGVLVEGK